MRRFIVVGALTSAAIAGVAAASQEAGSATLLCGFRAEASAAPVPGPPTDCGKLLTNPAPEYDPAHLFDVRVVFHVLQATDGGGYVSPETIAGQMEVLNADFSARAGTLAEGGTDTRIRFQLAQEDPDGQPSTGITYTTNDEWFADGGSYWTELAWDPERYLNVYVNDQQVALGYATAMAQDGWAGSAQDRIVMRWSAVGKDAPFGPPYHLGRTLGHEVGHYLGLYHTFEGGCASPDGCYANGDRVCDTPPQDVASSCARAVCDGGELPGNPMDYLFDKCKGGFTPEQANRMRCSIENWRPDLPTNFQVTGIEPASVPTLQVGPGTKVTITGSGFSAATSLALDGVPLTGYTVTGTKLTLDPPLPVVLGPTTLVVEHEGESMPLTLTYTENDPPALQVGTGVEPIVGPTSSTHELVVAGAPGALAVLVASTELSASLAPGLVHLDVGADFSALLPVGTLVLGAAGHAQVDLPFAGLPSLTTYYLQAVAVGAAPDLPLPTTNTQEVFVTF
ncbi:MAG: M43 family zinc metalloprotease [Planctomycetota bacterium]